MLVLPLLACRAQACTRLQNTTLSILIIQQPGERLHASCMSPGQCYRPNTASSMSPAAPHCSMLARRVLVFAMWEVVQLQGFWLKLAGTPLVIAGLQGAGVHDA